MKEIKLTPTLDEEARKKMVEAFGVSEQGLTNLLEYSEELAKESFIMGSVNILVHLLDYNYPSEDMKEFRSYAEGLLMSLRKSISKRDKQNEEQENTEITKPPEGNTTPSGLYVPNDS
jgi:hypothetical protein